MVTYMQQKIVSKLVNPYLLEYHTTIKIDNNEFIKLNKLFSIDGVANIAQRDNYCIIIHIGELFNPIQIKENLLNLVINNNG